MFQLASYQVTVRQSINNTMLNLGLYPHEISDGCVENGYSCNDELCVIGTALRL